MSDEHLVQPPALQYAKLIEDSKTHLRIAEDSLERILQHITMEKPVFLNMVYEIKQEMDRAMKDLNDVLYILDPQSEGYRYLEAFYTTQNNRYSKIKMELLMLISNKTASVRTANKSNQPEPTVYSWFLKLKQKENEFYIHFDAKDNTKFVDLARTYYEISEYLLIGLLHYLDDKGDDNSRNRRYLKITEAIELDSFCFEKFEEFMDSKMKSALAEISDSLKQILDEYYQDENGTQCLEIITRRLKLCAKKNKFENFSLKLDQTMKDLVDKELTVSKVVNEFSRIFQSKSEPKASIKQFQEIFKNFNRILIELELDKPDKMIHLNEFYQYAYFFMFFKICLKMFLLLSMQASLKRSGELSVEPVIV